MFKRRDFIVGTAAGLATVGLAPSAAIAATAGRSDGPAWPCVTAGDLRKAHFDALVGRRFTFADGAGRVAEAELEALSEGPHSSQVEQFSLRFRGEAAGDVPEGTYHVTEPTGETLYLHVIPGSRDGNAQYLRADFSLVV